MDIKKILEQQNNDYQLVVARAILSFSRADAATQHQLLKSYQAILQDEEDHEYYNRELQQNQGLSVEELDQYLDDPRHGQAEPLNRGEF